MNKKYIKLLQIYKKIPEIECKGLCHETCTIVPAAKIEIKRAKERLKGKNPFNPVNAKIAVTNDRIPACAALEKGRCSIYQARPAICRLYGVAEGLECPFGCKPGKTISRNETNKLIREIESL